MVVVLLVVVVVVVVVVAAAAAAAKIVEKEENASVYRTKLHVLHTRKHDHFRLLTLTGWYHSGTNTVLT